MTNPMDAMAAAAPTPTPYPRSSRYYNTPTAAKDDVPYLQRRLLPRPEDQVAIGEHVVGTADRADLLGDRYYGDAEAWWRIADANAVLDPDELTSTPGTRLRITLNG